MCKKHKIKVFQKTEHLSSPGNKMKKSNKALNNKLPSIRKTKSIHDNHLDSFELTSLYSSELSLFEKLSPKYFCLVLFFYYLYAC